MCILLIKSSTRVYNHSDPEKNLRGVYSRGDIIYVFEDGHEFARGEQPPHVAVLNVPGVPVNPTWNTPWYQEIDWEILQTNPAQDTARLRIFHTLPAGDGRYNVTREQVEGFINLWNGTVFDVNPNSIRFDVSIEGCYTSEGFWGRPPASVNIIITELDYNQGTGIHTAEIDATLSSLSGDTVRHKIESSGAIITDIVGRVGTVEFSRDVVNGYFLQALRRATKKTVVRRRHSISEADLDLIIAAGGSMTVTEAQLNVRLIDKAL